MLKTNLAVTPQKENGIVIKVIHVLLDPVAVIKAKNAVTKKVSAFQRMKHAAAGVSNNAMADVLATQTIAVKMMRIGAAPPTAVSKKANVALNGENLTVKLQVNAKLIAARKVKHGAKVNRIVLKIRINVVLANNLIVNGQTLASNLLNVVSTVRRNMKSIVTKKESALMNVIAVIGEKLLAIVLVELQGQIEIVMIKMIKNAVRTTGVKRPKNV